MNTRRIIVIAMSLLSGVCFGVALSTYLMTGGYLSKHYRAYIVQSGSMAPALPVGSIVITKAAAVYSEGDIITFTPEGTKNQVTHRVVASEVKNGETSFITKGDANEEADSWRIPQNQITGKSFVVVPKLGYLADFVRTPKGFVALVVIPASIIIYEELKAIVRELTKLFFNRKGNSKNGVKAAAAIPVLGILLMLAGPTSSFVFNTETSRLNFFSADTFSTTPTPSPTPEPELNLVINEFMPHPSPGPDWVEIYNPTPADIDLTNWKLSDLTGDITTLSGILNPLSFLVVEVSNRLNNGGDTIFLKDQNVVIDEYQYTSDPGINKSIGRQPDGSDDFKNCTEPSKGESNNEQC